MKRKEKERVIVVGGTSERMLQDAINDALESNEEARLQDVDLATLRAWIRVTEIILTAETLREKYELRGIRPKCGDCPYYVAPTDKRRRCGHCDLMTGVDPRDDVCDAFFRWMETGEVAWEGGRD